MSTTPPSRGDTDSARGAVRQCAYALVPDLLWTGHRFERGWRVCVATDGRIEAVERSVGAGDFPEYVLGGRALLPGFANAHSHAFQRAIRGRTHLASSPDDDFWSWRTAMHAAAAGLSPESCGAVAALAYVEMLEAGFTSVGEFHYIHRTPDGEPYDDPHAMALAVLEAAQFAGIRTCLLRAVSLRTGFEAGEPTPGQRRFFDSSLGEALALTEELRRRVLAMADARLSCGVAPHSVRAVPPQALTEIASWARQHALPLHIHASEQPAEVQACLAATRKRPVELLDDCGVLGWGTTAVHATHVDQGEVQRLAQSETIVCLCPTTEADLGDGLVPAGPLLRAGAAFALGSDSNAQIDPFAEMRALEYGERLRVGRRNQIVHAATGRVGPMLLDAATRVGALSLGIPAGKMLPGYWADLVSLNLDALPLAGWTDDSAADFVALHSGVGAVDTVWVAGKPVVENGRHLLRSQAIAGFRHNFAADH